MLYSCSHMATVDVKGLTCGVNGCVSWVCFSFSSAAAVCMWLFL